MPEVKVDEAVAAAAISKASLIRAAVKSLDSAAQSAPFAAFRL
jgi:hypothetical protein